MNVSGERVLLFGDSLSHHGSDGDPEIWDVDAGSDRLASAPGDLLASMIAEAGATAVRIDANVGRSAHNFWNTPHARFQQNDPASLIASDQQFAPTKVIVMLGTNDADSGAIDPAAMAQIRDSFPTATEILAIGPPVFADATLSTKVDQVYSMLNDVFGGNVIDARPLSSTDNRAGDGVHFQPQGALDFASQLAPQVMAISPGTQKTIWWVAIGAVLLGAAGVGYWMWSRRKLTLAGDEGIYHSHYATKAKKRRERIPAYFVDPGSGDVIDVDLRTAKYRRDGDTEFRGPNMLSVIAKESRTPEEFARRAEAWASTESDPPSTTTIAKAYRRASPAMITRLVREARDARVATTRSRWRGYINQPDEEDLGKVAGLARSVLRRMVG